MFAHLPRHRRSFGRTLPTLICLAGIVGSLAPGSARAISALPTSVVLTPAYPSRAAIGPGTGLLFVAGPATNTTNAGPKGGLVRSFDGTTGALLARTTLGGQVLALEVGGQVEVRDTRTGALRHPSTQSFFPLRGATDARTGCGFALQSDAVRVFNARSGATLRTVPAEVNPIGLVVDEQSGKVLVVSHGPFTQEYQCGNGCGGSVAVLSATSGAVLAATHFPKANIRSEGVYENQRPIALAFDAPRRRLYVSRAEGLLSVFDSAGGKPIRAFPGEGGSIALDPVSGTLVVVGSFGERATPPTGTVTLIDPTSGKTLASLAVSGHLAAPVLDGAAPAST